jgi:hypothetical protein
MGRRHNHDGGGGDPEPGATPAHSQVGRGWRRRLDVASLQGPLLEAANAPVREVLSYL